MELKIKRWIAAYSGGLDSTVLLHLINRTAKEQKIPLLAIHIDHGLSPASKDWAKHCRTRCKEWKISFKTISLQLQREKNKSLEGTAREARYRALSRFVKKGEALFTAHHQEDQAETFLLRLLRGAGIKGLGSMTEIKPFSKGCLIRPFLNVPREAILNYAKKNHLSWIEDPSNQNIQLDRNFLRHELFPKLKIRWPAAVKTISRAAQHCREGERLLEEIGEQDLKEIRITSLLNLPDFFKSGILSRLSIEALKKLAIPRQTNAIRIWLNQHAQVSPTELQMKHIFEELINSKIDAQPALYLENIELRRFNSEIYLLKRLKSFHIKKNYEWNLTEVLTLPIGQLTPDLARDVKKYLKGTFSVRFRKGGEHFHPENRSRSQSLKKLFQEWGIPPWYRDQIPLLYSDEKLIAVLGYAFQKGLLPTEGGSKNKSTIKKWSG